MTKDESIDLIPGGSLLGSTINITGKFTPCSVISSLFSDVGNNTWEDNSSKITYRLPSNFNVLERRENHAKVTTFNSFEEVSAHLSAEANLNIDGIDIPVLKGLLSFGGEAAFQFKTSFSEKVQYSYAWVDDSHLRWTLSLDNIGFDYLNDSVKAEITNLPSTFNESNQDQFFSLFDKRGIFFVSEVNVGAKLYYSATVLEAAVEGKFDVSAKLNAEFNAVKALEGSVTAKEDWGIAGKAWVKNRSVVVDSIGGDTSIMNFASPEYGESFGSKFEQWLKSIESAPAPISYSLQSIANVVKPEAKEATEQAINAYLNRNTLEIKTHSNSTYQDSSTPPLKVDLPVFRVQSNTLVNTPADPKPAGVRVAILSKNSQSGLWESKFDKYYFADHVYSYVLTNEICSQIISEVESHPDFVNGSRVLLTYFNIWGVGPCQDPGPQNITWYNFLTRCGAGKDTYNFMCASNWCCASALVSSYSLFGIIGDPENSIEEIQAHNFWDQNNNESSSIFVDRTIFLS